MTVKFMVAVAMQNRFKICPHCRRNLNIRVGDGFGFHFHWVDDFYLIDVVLYFPDIRKVHVLYREVYVVK